MTSARRFAHYSILSGSIVTAALFPIAGLSVSLTPTAVATVGLGSLSVFLCALYEPREAGMQRIVSLLEVLSLLALGTMIAGLASYPVAALSRGWIDPVLLAGDRLLGLEWLGYWDFVQAHPGLYAMLGAGYFSIFASPAVLTIALILTGRVPQAYRFAAAYIAALALTDAIFLLAPGKSAAAMLLPPGAPNAPTPGLRHIPIIDSLRAGSFGPVDVGQLDGLIAFPSFHATAAVLFAWAAWRMPMLRCPGLLLYGLMLASTPIQGGHYFVETIGGVIVAIVAIAVASRLAATDRMSAVATMTLDAGRTGNTRPTPA